MTSTIGYKLYKKIYKDDIDCYEFRPKTKKCKKKRVLYTNIIKQLFSYIIIVIIKTNIFE